jgi:UDP-N-acetylmuramoyl-tripeptide--D-alanyl-D-alanine ligase
MNFLKNLLVAILTLESRLIIRKYKPFIVAVTGSVGKTSAKDAIYDVIKDQSKYVRKSQKSMNSEIGLPLTVIGAPNAWHSLGGWMKNIGLGLGLILRRSDYPDCLILEVGADHPGDIKNLTKWLHPDITVITKISQTPVHVEFFKSPEEVFEEKASLATAVKSGGTLVLFADDEKTLTLAERVKNSNVKVVTYGMSPSADVKGSNSKAAYDRGQDQVESFLRPIGFDFDLNVGGESRLIVVKNIIGDVYIYPLLAATAVGLSRGMSVDEIVKSLSVFQAPKGRMNLIPGLNGSTLIDDTYNSSPDAALAALEALKNLQCAGSKIAVLADMMELGKFAVPEHRRVGKAATTIVSELITVGRRSQFTLDEAVSNGFPKDKTRNLDTALEAADYLSAKVKSGDIVLVKGSQSMRMERVVIALMAEPDKAGDLLVRQEREWLEKR